MHVLFNSCIVSNSVKSILGFTVTDGFSQQTSFTAVQQLQDSSTLESQALSTSYQQPTLMEVPTPDTINVVSVQLICYADTCPAENK